jgi:hypothetical protein
LRGRHAARRPGRAARRARRVRQRQVDAAAHGRRGCCRSAPARSSSTAGPRPGMSPGERPGRDGVRDRRAHPVPGRGRQHGLGTAGRAGCHSPKWTVGWPAGPGSSGSTGSCTASPTSSPRVSAGWSASDGRWCRRRGRSCSTSRSPILDAAERLRVRHRIVEVVRSLAVTTLYVTHEPTEALAVADRVALLHEGRVRQLDPPGAPLRPAGRSARRGHGRADRPGTGAGGARREAGRLPGRRGDPAAVGTRHRPKWTTAGSCSGSGPRTWRTEAEADAVPMDAVVTGVEYTGRNHAGGRSRSAPRRSPPPAPGWPRPAGRRCGRSTRRASWSGPGTRCGSGSTARRAHVFDAATGRALHHP